ncbi:MAG: HD domain-containing protein [Prevotella sp.]|nr:HD domain-containing protein [Prevotella sp.]
MVNLEIMEYVERDILPRYNSFGPSHDIRHAQVVIRDSLVLARQLGVDEDMAYVVAAYHDLGLSGPRAVHHITGGKILAADARLKRWFSPEQRRIMKEAIEDHRASASHAPRSIYGRIVAEADRQLEPEQVLRRTVLFGVEHYPGLDKERHWERFANHLQNKYSETGYIRLWIANSPNEERLRRLRALIADKDSLRKAFDNIYDNLNL